MIRNPRIILLTSNFYPEKSGIANYSTDLAGLLSWELDVSVITTFPHYPRGSTFESPDNFSNLKNLSSETRVIRLNSYIPEKLDALGRARFEFSIIFRGLARLREVSMNRADLVVSVVPSLSIGVLGVLYSFLFRSPLIAIFQDLSSAAAREVGKKSFKILYIPSLLVEKLILWKAKMVVAVSNEMAEEMKRIQRKNHNIKIVPNYPITEFEKIDKKVAKHKVSNFEDKFIVLYSGNFGYKQDLVNVIQSAEKLIEYPEIKIVLMGHGNTETELKSISSSLFNVDIIPFVGDSEYPLYLMAADVLLSTEGESVKTMSLPSKLASYYSAGRPVLVVSSADSATARFVNNSAMLVAPGKPDQLTTAILQLYKDSALRETLELKAREFASSKMRADLSRSEYLASVYEVLKDNSPNVLN